MFQPECMKTKTKPSSYEVLFQNIMLNAEQILQREPFHVPWGKLSFPSVDPRLCLDASKLHQSSDVLPTVYIYHKPHLIRASGFRAFSIYRQKKDIPSRYHQKYIHFLITEIFTGKRMSSRGKMLHEYGEKKIYMYNRIHNARTFVTTSTTLYPLAHGNIFVSIIRSLAPPQTLPTYWLTKRKTFPINLVFKLSIDGNVVCKNAVKGRDFAYSSFFSFFLFSFCRPCSVSRWHHSKQ